TSADGDAVRSMATQATNGVNDAVSGIPKGIGNFPAVTLNGLTDLAFNGRGGVYVPGPNPFAVPLPFSGGNAREESYISAGTTGFGLGLGPALGVFGGGSSLLSVVPEISSTEPLPTLLFDYNTHPDLAENIWHAQRAGHPETLTWQGPSRVNRTNALRDVPSGILTRDEYPFASTAEGGTGAWVGHVPGSQNFSQGRMIQNFVKANNMQPGNRFVVCVINYSGC
ncbi:MAG: NucA/NucB deoxyribonuclease domain-containing protein, partial [Acidobacteriota bacterium]